jgi:hypothetical protein
MMSSSKRPNRGFWTYLLWLVLMSIALATAARGEDRALLIGVGRYANFDTRLNGVSLDLAMMSETARRMGFRQEAIRILKHENATASRVHHEFSDWLIKGVGPDDRVLIYFSGHGSQVWDHNQDEADGFDEVLLLYDTHLSMENGRQTLHGVLHDDRFHRWLGQIKSRHILVILDACHSGSATRGLRRETRSTRFGDAQVKYFYYSPLLESTAGGRFDVTQPAGTGDIDKRYIALTACRDDEKTLATASGSIFTLGIHQAVRSAAASGNPITPEELRRQTTKFIRNQIPRDRMAFHPQINGHLALRGRPLELVALSDTTAKGQQDFVALVEKGYPTVGLQLNKRCFEPGDVLQVTVRIDEPGYLNIISVRPDNRTVVLFPNRHHPQNKVVSGMLTIPSAQMGFELISEGPPGPGLIAAFLTRSPENGYTPGLRNPRDFLADFSPISKRSLILRQKNDYLAGATVSVVLREEGGCNSSNGNDNALK